MKKEIKKTKKTKKTIKKIFKRLLNIIGFFLYMFIIIIPLFIPYVIIRGFEKTEKELIQPLYYFINNID